MDIPAPPPGFEPVGGGVPPPPPGFEPVQAAAPPPPPGFEPVTPNEAVSQRFGEMQPPGEPPKQIKGIGERAYEGFRGTYGDKPLGFRQEDMEKYPSLTLWNPIAAG